MVGICWFMYAIMHAHASGLLGIFQAESPKIALPMRSSLAVRGRRRKFPSRSVNGPEPVNAFESTCQTQTSWVNVSYVTSTRNLDEPLRWVQRHSTPRQLRQHHEVLFRCFPALCILRSGICDMKYFRRIPWYAAVHLAHRLASIGFDRRHHRCAGQNRCTSTWNALIDYRDALLRCRCRFTAPCMATTSPYMAITWRAISPLLHKWPLLAVNGHILHQIMVIYWQVMGT